VKIIISNLILEYVHYVLLTIN